MRRILFVCTGNTCRSSMAEAIFKNALDHDESLSDNYSVASVGIAAFEGDQASTNALAALRELWGIDASSHRSKRISKNQIDDAWLILTMTRAHKQAILSIYPETKSKVYTLKEYINFKKGGRFEGFGCSPDIQDPYGMNLNTYKQCAKELKEFIDELVIKLKNNG